MTESELCMLVREKKISEAKALEMLICQPIKRGVFTESLKRYVSISR